MIAIWPATAPDQSDASTHFWYEAPGSRYRRICDDLGWPIDTPLISDVSRAYAPCTDCRGLYVEDIMDQQALLPVTDVRPSPREEA